VRIVSLDSSVQPEKRATSVSREEIVKIVNLPAADKGKGFSSASHLPDLWNKST
jgi:hypothetical protein